MPSCVDNAADFARGATVVCVISLKNAPFVGWNKVNASMAVFVFLVFVNSFEKYCLQFQNAHQLQDVKNEQSSIDIAHKIMLIRFISS